MTSTTPLEQLLTIKQTAKLLNVGQGSLIGLGIPYIRFKHTRRYDPADIRAWMAENRVNPDDVRGTAPKWPERKRRAAAKRAGEPLNAWDRTLERIRKREEREAERRKKLRTAD
jgi:hypothetical protein